MAKGNLLPSPCSRATQLHFQFPAMAFGCFPRTLDPSSAGDKEESELCIVLLGKAGVGKSATGNTLLGRERFHSAFSAKPTTQKVEKESGDFNGQAFSVIDTPAVSSSKSLTNHKQEIKKPCKSSPYVLVFVITVGRFTLEDKKTAKMVKKVFGEKDCGSGYFALNNKAAEGEKEEVSRLMENLRQMLHGDGSRPCTEKGKEGKRKRKRTEGCSYII